MNEKRKHFKRLRRFFREVFSDGYPEQGIPAAPQFADSSNASNASMNSIVPEVAPPVAASSATATLNPSTTDAAPAAGPSAQALEPSMAGTVKSSAVKGSSTTEKIKYEEWSGLKGFAAVLSKTPNAFGPLKHALDLLVSFIGTFETAAQSRTDLQEIKTQLNGLFDDLRKYIDTPVPPTMTASIGNLEKGIAKEAGLIEYILRRNGPNRYLNAQQDVEEVVGCYRRIEGLFRRLMLNANIDTWKTIDELTTETYIKGLPHSDAAYYRSPNASKLKRGGCTENTRVDVLQKLHDWASGASSQKIYWLNGMAGTGKTTISYSFCKQLEEKQTLAASFFCSRQLPDCRAVNQIVPTIAYQLSRFSTPFLHVISPILKADPDLHNKPIHASGKSIHGCNRFWDATDFSSSVTGWN